MLEYVGLRLGRAIILLLLSAVMPAGAVRLSAPSVDKNSVTSTVPAAGLLGKHQSVLYRVWRDGQTAYLFGTIHVGTSALYPLATQVRNALHGSSELVLELDTRVDDGFSKAILAHGSYTDSEQLKNALSAETMRKLTAALHAQGITVASVSRFKPWLIANLLTGWELQRNGYERDQGNEFMLLEQASAQGKPIRELESADYQLGLFDTMTPEQSERYLLETLAQLADGTSLRKAEATIVAWTSGDAAALDSVMGDATDGDGTVATFTRDVLLKKRNPEMASRIERIMQTGKTACVGVGLLHLLGSEGLPELLAQHGYQVERVQ